MKRCYYELEFLDVDKKWVDDTKTTIQLVYYDEIGNKTILGYVHDDLDIENAKIRAISGFYLNLIFEEIRRNALYNLCFNA